MLFRVILIRGRRGESLANYLPLRYPRLFYLGQVIKLDCLFTADRDCRFCLQQCKYRLAIGYFGGIGITKMLNHNSAVYRKDKADMQGETTIKADIGYPFL